MKNEKNILRKALMKNTIVKFSIFENVDVF